MNTQRPHPMRCLLLLLLALACATFLIEVDKQIPWPTLNLSEFPQWWEQQGTAVAAITLLRALGTAIAGWGMLIGAAGFAAGIRPSNLLTGVWRRVTPKSFRQILAVTVLSATLAAPLAASASPISTSAEFVMEDLGATSTASRTTPHSAIAHTFTPVLTDLGPANNDALRGPPAVSGSASGPPSATPTPTANLEVSTPAKSQEWTVAPGDHLWQIARSALRDQGIDAKPAQVAQYWRQLIAANVNLLDNNPDLIHPGLVLALPQVQPQT